jgi:hypothetical protein
MLCVTSFVSQPARPPATCPTRGAARSAAGRLATAKSSTPSRARLAVVPKSIIRARLIDTFFLAERIVPAMLAMPKMTIDFRAGFQPARSRTAMTTATLDVIARARSARSNLFVPCEIASPPPAARNDRLNTPKRHSPALSPAGSRRARRLREWWPGIPG